MGETKTVSAGNPDASRMSGESRDSSQLMLSNMELGRRLRERKEKEGEREREREIYISFALERNVPVGKDVSSNALTKFRWRNHALEIFVDVDI